MLPDEVNKAGEEVTAKVHQQFGSFCKNIWCVHASCSCAACRVTCHFAVPTSEAKQSSRTRLAIQSALSTSL